jgi:hypothetical protein
MPRDGFKWGEKAYRICEEFTPCGMAYSMQQQVIEPVRAELGLVVSDVRDTCGWLVEEHPPWFRDTRVRWSQPCHSELWHFKDPNVLQPVRRVVGSVGTSSGIAIRGWTRGRLSGTNRALGQLTHIPWIELV